MMQRFLIQLQGSHEMEVEQFSRANVQKQGSSEHGT